MTVNGKKTLYAELLLPGREVEERESRFWVACKGRGREDWQQGGVLTDSFMSTMTAGSKSRRRRDLRHFRPAKWGSLQLGQPERRVKKGSLLCPLWFVRMNRGPSPPRSRPTSRLLRPGAACLLHYLASEESISRPARFSCPSCGAPSRICCRLDLFFFFFFFWSWFLSFFLTQCVPGW
jgi:hypothetical protein